MLPLDLVSPQPEGRYQRQPAAQCRTRDAIILSTLFTFTVSGARWRCVDTAPSSRRECHPKMHQTLVCSASTACRCIARASRSCCGRYATCMQAFNRACDSMCLSDPVAPAAAQATSRSGARTCPDDASPGTFPVFVLLLIETDGAIQTSPAPSPSADNHVCFSGQTLPCLLHVSVLHLAQKAAARDGNCSNTSSYVQAPASAATAAALRVRGLGSAGMAGLTRVLAALAGSSPHSAVLFRHEW